MISNYNRSQLVKGALSIVVGIVAYVVAWFFFRYGVSVAVRSLGGPPPVEFAAAVSALALITLSGYRHWRKGGGFTTYVESSLFHNLGADAAGAVVVDHYAKRLTGPAYVLSQFFLAGPLMVLRGARHFRQRLVPEPGLEARLHQTLNTLRVANRWQGINEYPQIQREILILVQMRKVDFSAYKGSPRIKAASSGG